MRADKPGNSVPTMHKTILALTVSVLFVAGAGRLLGGQSLAEFARQEEARRKAVRDPAKVLTNKDLGPAPIISAPVPTNAPQAAKDAEPAKQGDGKDSPKEPVKD